MFGVLGASSVFASLSFAIERTRGAVRFLTARLRQLTRLTPDVSALSGGALAGHGFKDLARNK